LFRRLCVRCFRQSTDSRHAERHLPFCQLPTRNVKTGRGPSSPAVICILCDGSGRKDHSIPTPRGYCMGSSVRYCKLQLLIPSPSISLKGGRISKASAAQVSGAIGIPYESRGSAFACSPCSRVQHLHTSNVQNNSKLSHRLIVVLRQRLGPDTQCQKPRPGPGGFRHVR
jgi:hypothetical protein